jgi:hypothetical protein
MTKRFWILAAALMTFVALLWASSARGATSLPFVALPPCRVIDTRGNAPLAGGFLPAATVRSYAVTGVCGIPPGAQALSLNATVVHPTGPGFLTLWPDGGAFPPVSTLNYLGGDVVVNAAVVPLSAAGGISMALGVSGGDVILDVNGYYTPLSAVTSLNGLAGSVTLTASGDVVLTPGAQSVAIGTNATTAAAANTLARRDASGNLAANTFFGSLQGTASGNLGLAGGTMTGPLTLNQGLTLASGSKINLQGGGLTYFGNNLLSASDGTSAFFGQHAGDLATGTFNVAIGNDALYFSSGTDNVAVGSGAGSTAAVGSHNVYLANPGPAFTENNTIRLGAGGTHLKIFLAAVRGVTTGQNNALPVMIDGAGQLGTTSSSIRFKTDVRDLGDPGDALARLRPVTFRYKTEAPEGDPHFGLVAEEVATALPALVVRDASGAPESVKYHELPALLLGEIQRQRNVIIELTKRIEALETK